MVSRNFVLWKLHEKVQKTKLKSLNPPFPMFSHDVPVGDSKSGFILRCEWLYCKELTQRSVFIVPPLLL